MHKMSHMERRDPGPVPAYCNLSELKNGAKTT